MIISKSKINKIRHEMNLRKEMLDLLYEKSKQGYNIDDDYAKHLNNERIGLNIALNILIGEKKIYNCNYLPIKESIIESERKKVAKINSYN